MRAKVSKRLVIDASVARSAGGADATFPLSKQCRDFLKTTLAVCHRVVLTSAVRQEWKKHESGFARGWRAAMMARKKLLLEDAPEDSTLREALEDAAATDRGRRAMLKDTHLVESALATDRTVVSLDDTVRSLFAAASRPVRSLKKIVWANPAHLGEECEGWLRDGAPEDGHRQLASWRPQK